jgi:hypothetical protein
LNRWAESVEHYLTEQDLKEDLKELKRLGYDGLFQRCALFYLYFAEPFNWAWHIHHMAKGHTETAADLLGRLKAHKRVPKMVKLAGVDVLNAKFSGTQEWTEPFKAFYNYMVRYCGEEVVDGQSRDVFVYTFPDLTNRFPPLPQPQPPPPPIEFVPDTTIQVLNDLYTDLQKRAVGEVPSSH